jgi:hypothetical protein
MEITNNLLLFNRLGELNNKLIMYFFNRIKLFLVADTDVPSIKIVFTGNKSVINKYYAGEQGSDCLGFYDHKSNTIVLNAELYQINSKHFRYANREFFNKDVYSEYKYFVPISDLYHELVHHFQFHLGSYKYDSLLEGSADLFMHILTGQNNIDYELESTAIWYVGRKVLKYNLTNFYNFVVSIINNEDDTLQQRFSNNKSIIKTVANKYNGDWQLFFKNLHKEYGNRENLENMKKELIELHNLIFYKY